MEENSLIYQMHNDIHLDFIVIIIGVIIGLCIAVFGRKINDKIKGWLISTYFGMIIGAMAGYVIGNSIYSMLLGVGICLLISVVTDRRLITIFVFTMQISFIIMTFITQVYIGFMEKINNFTVKMEIQDGLGKNYAILSAIILGIIVTFIYYMTHKKSEERPLNKIIYIFIGTFQCIGIILSYPQAELYSDVDWENFFMTYIGVNYDEYVFPFAMFITIIVLLIYYMQMQKTNNE